MAKILRQIFAEFDTASNIAILLSDSFEGDVLAVVDCSQPTNKALAQLVLDSPAGRALHPEFLETFMNRTLEQLRQEYRGQTKLSSAYNKMTGRNWDTSKIEEAERKSRGRAFSWWRDRESVTYQLRYGTISGMIRKYGSKLTVRDLLDNIIEGIALREAFNG